MERLSLANRVAVVTGSSSGIGEVTAKLFAQRGAKVTLHGRNEDRLAGVKNAIIEAGAKPDEVHVVVGDITEDTVRTKLVQETVDKFGSIDILVNNAGGGDHGAFLRDITEQQLDTAFNVYLKAPVLLTKLCLPHLVKTKGNIINISGMTVTEVLPMAFGYGSFAKAGLENFTKFAAVEFGNAGVRVNCVRPGVIVTPIFDKAFPSKAIYDQFLASSARRTLLSTNGTAEDVAEIIAFYASDAAQFITGDFTIVDGGRSIHTNHGEKQLLEANYDDFLKQYTGKL